MINEVKKSPSFKSNGVVVNLNGILHTDDRLALQDITRQLNMENVVEDKVYGTIAGTLTSVQKVSLIIMNHCLFLCNLTYKTKISLFIIIFVGKFR